VKEKILLSFFLFLLSFSVPVLRILFPRTFKNAPGDSAARTAHARANQAGSLRRKKINHF
jgi:hypothetical protein